MKRYARPFVTALALVSSLAPPVAHAAWPSDPTVNVPVCTVAGTKAFHASLPDGAGGSIIAWEDYRSGYSDIYAQRVDAAGALQWPVAGVAVCTGANNQFAPVIVSDGAGGAIVAWQDARSGDYDIYAQRLSGAGVPQWNAAGVAICTAVNTQFPPAMIPDGAGGAILTWYDGRNGSSHIYAQRVNGAGVTQWTADGVALCSAANNQLHPTLATDGAGGAIVTWYDGRSGTSYDIYAQRVSAAGVPQWTADGVPICTAANDQLYPTTVSDGAGGAIIAWYDFRSGTNYDIYAQRVTATGSPWWTADGVALCTASGDQDTPEIVPDDAGGAIVTWLDLRNGISNADIYSQRVDRAGTPLWIANGVPVCTAANNEYDPTCIADGTGGVIVTWDDRRNSNGDIYAQRVSAAGTPLWTVDGVALCSADNIQIYPTISSDGGAGGVVAWDDHRSGVQYDIYAQNINADGTLGGYLLGVSPPESGGEFRLRSVGPNPGEGRLTVSFSLPDASPAMLELFDVGGRRIESVSVGGLGRGSHDVTLGSGSNHLAAGVYAVRLAQGEHRALLKAAILR